SGAGKVIVRDTVVLRHHRWNNIATEVMLCGAIASLSGSRILDQRANEGIAIEDVDAHRTKRATRLVGLLFKGDDLPLGIGFQNAKAVSFFQWHNPGT